MITNTYLPHVSGVAQSVARFSDVYRKSGHETLIVAPTYEEQPVHEENVIRIPAVQHFNGSDLSVVLPVPRLLKNTLHQFSPELIHSHHPFLLGDTALRIAAARSLPLVYTYHTMYEQYTHYVPVHARNLANAVIKLTTGYANLCDHLIAPSNHVMRLLRDRGVNTPITVIPTGVDTKQYTENDHKDFRAQHHIPQEAFVAGHVGRLAPEKNVVFLAKAAAQFLQEYRDSYFVVAGQGAAQTEMQQVLRPYNVDARVRFVGALHATELMAAYNAFDVFCFASKSETQGMVLIEAMTAGVPVIALNVPPVDEVVQDAHNGLLVDNASAPHEFTAALMKFRSLVPERRKHMQFAARETAQQFDTRHCAMRALSLYEKVLDSNVTRNEFDETTWTGLLHVISEEWKIWANRMAAAAEAVAKEPQ